MTDAPGRRLPFSIRRRDWFRLAALLIALAAAAPLLQDAALLNTRGGGDSPFLLQRLQQLVAALQDGHFPVRWMPDAAYGYGYPFFNYYAPLSIYVAALFRFLGAPYTDAIQIAQLTAFLLAAWASWELARRWLHDDWAALLASAAYTLAPFHLLNVYVRGDSLAEFWAMAFFPLLLLTADRLLAPGDGEPDGPLPPAARGARVVQLALAYAGLILSHNISALIFSPFLLLYVLLYAWRAPRRKLLPAAGALLLGLLLAAWFWVPALGETALAQTAPLTAGYFHYSNHFRSAGLVQASLLFDWEVAGQAAFRMGLVQALLILAGLISLFWRRRRPAAAGRRPEPLLFVAATLLVATLMITPLSRWLWDHLPLLPYTQFPWRFLSVQALAGAIVSGGLALLPGRRLWAIGGMALLLVAMLAPLRPDHFIITDDDVTPLALARYEWFTGNIGTTVSAEYLPHWVQPRPYTSAWLNSGERDAAQTLSGAAEAALLARRATRQLWQVSVADDGATVQFPTLYWPGWQGRLGDAALALAPAPGSGLISAELPPGRHTVELHLARTPLRLAAELLSLATLLLLLVWAVPRWAAVRRRVAARRRSVAVPIALFVLLAVVALTWRLRPQPQFDESTLSWDFAQMGYLHHAPQGIPFSDGSRLLHYAVITPTVLAGETLQITLQWQHAGAPTPATLSLVTPAANRFTHAPLLVSARQPAANGLAVYELPIPPGAPPGLYLPRLELAGAAALTPSGQPRGPLFLQPLHVAHPPQAAAEARPLDARLTDLALPTTLPALDAGAAGLFDCAAPALAAGALQLHVQWHTAQALSHNLTASLRLDDAGGQRLAQCDLQPGHGFLPSSAWTPGAWIPDRLALPLPPTLPPAAPYTLLVVLYDESGATRLTRRLGQLAWHAGELRFTLHAPQFDLPPAVQPLEARFGDAIALRGYELHQDQAGLRLTLYWQALQATDQDLARFVHLLQDENGAPQLQVDGAPQHGAYPTSQWTAGEIIADVMTFEAAELPGGDYFFAVGFYPPHDPGARLPVAGHEQAVSAGRLFIRP